VTLPLDVHPIQFAGGGADAAAALLDETLAALQDNASAAVDALDASTAPELIALIEGLDQSTTALRAHLRTMDPENRLVMAALYSSNQQLFDLVAAAFAEHGGTLATTQSEGRLSSVLGSLVLREPQLTTSDATPLPTAESLAEKCRRANLRLEATGDMLDAAAYFQFALPTLTLLISRDAQLAAGIGLTMNSFVVALNAAVVLQSLTPRFFDPDGLRLEPSKVRVPENGRTAELRAYLNLVNARGALADAANFGDALVDYGEYYRGLDDARRLAKKATLRRALIEIGQEAIVALLDETFDLLDELYDENFALTGGEIPIAMDGLEIRDINNTGLWRFTSPAAGASRTFVTTGQVRRDLGYEIVALNSTAGRGEMCMANTAAANPQQGLNGFLVTGPPILRSVRSEFVSLNSCQTVTGTGSAFRIYVDYFAANTMGIGSRVDVTWSFPDGSTGSYVAVNQTNPRLGSQGEFSFGYCARFADTKSTTIRFFATDPEGLRSNQLSHTMSKPAGSFNRIPGRAEPLADGGGGSRDLH
jgi:hypothetical protein